MAYPAAARSPNKGNVAPYSFRWFKCLETQGDGVPAPVIIGKIAFLYLL